MTESPEARMGVAVVAVVLATAFAGLPAYLPEEIAPATVSSEEGTRGGWAAAAGVEFEVLAHMGGSSAGTIALHDQLAYLGIGPKLAVVDVSDVGSPALIGDVYLGEFVRDVVVDEWLAYVAMRGGGLRLVDVTEPSSPRVVGRAATGGDVLALALERERNLVYAADDDKGVLIVDVSAASAPRVLASIPRLHQVNGIAAAEGRVYAVSTDGLLILDTSEPEAPATLGSLALEGYPESVAAAGNTAYVAARSAGLLMIDIAEPRAPRLISRQPTHLEARYVEVAANRAYVADGENGVRVIDVSDRRNPHEWAWFETDGSAEALAVRGSTVFVAVAGHGLRIVRLSEEGYLREVGSHAVEGAQKLASMGDLMLVTAPEGLVILGSGEDGVTKRARYGDLPAEPYGIAVDGNLAYVAIGGSGVWVIDLTDPWHPQHLGTFEAPGLYAYAVAVRDGVLYVVGSGDGELRIADVSDPSAPRQLSSHEISQGDGLPCAIALAGDVVYVGGWNMELSLVDVSTVASPRPIEVTGLPRFVTGLCSVGNRLYATDREGLRVYDVTDPAGPEELSRHPVPGIATAVSIEGRLAYVASSPDRWGHDYAPHAGLHVVDVSDPTSPTELGMYSTPGYAHSEVTDVVVRRQTAYVAARRGGVRVVDVAHKSTPAPAGELTSPTWVSAVEAASGSVFAAIRAQSYPPSVEQSALRRIEASGFGSPPARGDGTVGGEALGLAVAGDLAYVAGLGGGLMIADVSDPVAPEVVGRYEAPDCCKCVAVSRDRAYVTAVASLRVLDLSDPGQPRLVAELDTGNEAWGVAVSGDTLYLAVAKSGVWVLDVSDPADPERMGLFEASYPIGIELVGSTAYVADADGLHVVDVADPTRPTEIGRFHTSSAPITVEVVDDVAWIGLGGGFVALDARDKSRPRLLGSFASPTDVLDIALDGSLAYVAQRTGGLLVLSVAASYEHAHLPLAYVP